MSGKDKPFGTQDDDPLNAGLQPPRGSGDDRKPAGARKPGETRGSGDDR